MTYEKLRSIRNSLEKLSLTQAWSLRETDLYSYQRQLDRVDEARINGNFEDDLGNKADLHAQRVGSPLNSTRGTAMADNIRRSSIYFAAAMHTFIV